MLPLCGVEAKMVSDGHQHDGAQKSVSLVEVRLCTCEKVWRIDYYLTTLSTKNGANRTVVMVVLGVKAQMCEG